jgi:hypothetical protein
MKKPFLLGLGGGFLGILTAIFVIVTSTSNDVTLSGVQAALFSSLGLMGAVIANKDSRFAGYMLIFSAVFITLSIPLSGSISLFIIYLPAVLILGIASVLCFMEPRIEDEGDDEEPVDE